MRRALAARARRDRRRGGRRRAAAVRAQRLPPGARGAASRVYFIAILGLNILTGYTGQISIGHGAFMAIGGYTTAIMSHDHHTNLIADAAARVRDLLRLRRARRPAGAAALRRLPRARDVRARGVGAADAAEVLEVHGRQRRHPDRRRRSSHVAVRGQLGGGRDRVRRSPGSSCAAGPGARSGRSATARWRPTSSGVTLPIYKTLAFGVSAALRGRRRLALRPRDERLRAAERVRRHALAPDPRSARPSPGSARSGASSSARRSSGSCPRSRPACR